MPAVIVAVAAGAAGAAVTAAVGAGVIGMVAGAVASTVVAGVLSNALAPDQPAQQSVQQVQQSLSINSKSQVAPLYLVYGEVKLGGTVVVVGASDKVTTTSVTSTGFLQDLGSPNSIFLHGLTPGALAADAGDVVSIPGFGFASVVTSGAIANSGGDAQLSISNGIPWAGLAGLSAIGSSAIVTKTNPSTTEPNKFLHLIIAHCEGEVAGASMLYLDDIEYTDAKFSGLVYWEFFPGSDTQAASQTLISAGVGWLATDKLSGVCYSYVRLAYSSSVFSGIPTITVKMKGRKVLDPRTGLTAWSSNPALCLRDYLTNTRYGRGIPANLIDLPSFISVANICDSQFVDAAGTSRNLHTCNGAISPDSTTLDNARAILSAFRGRLVYSARGYSVLADMARATTFTFSADNIVGAWRIQLAGKRILLNKVTGSWINPADAWKQALYPADAPDFRVSDNGLMLESRIDLPFTTNQFEAQILCERELRQSRFGMAVSFTAFMAGMACEVGDVVAITHPTPGWVGKPFTITRISLLNTDEVTVEAREYDAAVYGPHTLTAPRQTYTTLLPEPDSVPAFSGAQASSGTAVLQLMPDGTVVSRIKLSWTPSAQIYLDEGEVEIQHKQVASANWVSAFARASTAEYFISPAQDAAVYDIRLRWVNEFRRVGGWQVMQHTVVGKREPPVNVTGLTAILNGDRIQLEWAVNPDVDLAEYEIRQGSVWETALVVGKTRSTLIKVVPNYAGIRSWLVKAIDTTGNYSISAASASYLISAPPATTIQIQVIDNNVLLYWQEVRGTLPTRTYLIKRGDAYATAEVIGTKDGLFTTIFETQSATYRYWVTAVDIAGNEGGPTYTTAVVNEPPDYVLHDVTESSFSGVKVNAAFQAGKLTLPVSLTQSWAQHFSVNGWSTVQDQVTAGCPVYAQPSMLAGYYEEVVDYGAVLAGFKATVLVDSALIGTAQPIAGLLSVSADGITYSTPLVGFTGFFTNFRYLKIRLTANSSDATGLASISRISIRLDAKRKTWGGKVVCNAADVGGTICYLTKDAAATGDKVFTDVLSLTPGANSTNNINPVFDFKDVPNPLSFSAYLFDAAGVRISGTVYYSAIGI